MQKGPKRKDINWERRVKKIFLTLDQEKPIMFSRLKYEDKKDAQYDMHSSLELGVVLSGKMKRYYKERTLVISPGQVWICGAWEPHGWEVAQAPCQAIIFIILPSPSLVAKTKFGTMEGRQLFQPFYTPVINRPQVTGKDLNSILYIAKSLTDNFSLKEDLNTAWINLKFCEILLILQKSYIKHTDTSVAGINSLSKINEIIRLVCEDKKFMTTQQAAKFFGNNRNCFSEKFKSLMVVSFSEFCLRFRVSSAARELISTDKVMKTIAIDWGFTDTSHLNKSFVKYYKMTPSQFRSGKEH